jgi:hypothetical protein
MHDLFQTHPLLASYYGIPAPYGIPAGIGSPSLQPSLNFGTALNPIAALSGHMGQPPYMGFTATSPFAAGLQNPVVAALSNPLIAAALQSQLNPNLALVQQALAQQLASQANWPYQQYQQQPFGQLGSSFGQQLGQIGSPFNQGFGQGVSPFGQIGSPLAPQSWIGQQVGAQGAQPFALPQVHSLLSQLTGRPTQPGGISPLGW